jgi:shikimate kinase
MMTEAESPAVVLIGAPGAGKTRIGKRVARLLGLPFVDTDKRVVALHGAITAIFENHGEPHFRVIEREQVEQALKEHAVVSLGGGAVLDAVTQAELVPLRVVQLVVQPEAIANRDLSSRPLLTGGLDAWKKLVAERAPIYDRLADVSFDTTTVPADRVADDIVRWLKENS